MVPGEPDEEKHVLREEGLINSVKPTSERRPENGHGIQSHRSHRN